MSFAAQSVQSVEILGPGLSHVTESWKHFCWQQTVVREIQAMKPAQVDWSNIPDYQRLLLHCKAMLSQGDKTLLPPNELD